MTEFTHKLVAILNKDIDQGIIMNALAHMSIGMGGAIARDLDIKDLKLDNYIDADQNIYPDISDLPFIILRGKSSEIRKTARLAKEQNIKHSIFLDTMRIGTYIEQLERTKNTKYEDLIFYGLSLFGKWDEISELTRKFSLWR